MESNSRWSTSGVSSCLGLRDGTQPSVAHLQESWFLRPNRNRWLHEFTEAPGATRSPRSMSESACRRSNRPGSSPIAGTTPRTHNPAPSRTRGSVCDPTRKTSGRRPRDERHRRSVGRPAGDDQTDRRSRVPARAALRPVRLTLQPCACSTQSQDCRHGGGRNAGLWVSHRKRCVTRMSRRVAAAILGISPDDGDRAEERRTVPVLRVDPRRISDG
jgi:hypothetical protein